jgi:sugar phosphate isomerase/epimerase
MVPLRIGIQLASLRLPFKQAIANASELGADAVEIDARSEIDPKELSATGIRQIRKLLSDRNLRVGALSFRTRHGYNVAEGLEQRVDATKKVMTLAFKLGASVVVNHVGRVSPKPDASEWGMLVDTLTDLGRHGQYVGAMLAATTGSESGEDLGRLIQSLPAGSLGVDFDPGGLIVNGFSPRESLIALGSHVLHVHARDGVRDLAQGRGLETPLGQGTADFPELAGILAEHGYQGYWTVARETAQNPMAEIAQAIRFLRGIG